MAAVTLDDLRLLLDHGEVDAAFPHLARMVVDMPAYLPAWVLLARAFEHRAQWPEAQKIWAQIAFMAPEAPVVRDGLRDTRRKMRMAAGTAPKAVSAPPPAVSLPPEPVAPPAARAAFPPEPVAPPAPRAVFPPEPVAPPAARAAFPPEPVAPPAARAVFPPEPVAPPAARAAFPPEPVAPPAPRAVFPPEPVAPPAPRAVFPPEPVAPPPSRAVFPPEPVAPPAPPVQNLAPPESAQVPEPRSFSSLFGGGLRPAAPAEPAPEAGVSLPVPPLQAAPARRPVPDVPEDPFEAPRAWNRPAPVTAVPPASLRSPVAPEPSTKQNNGLLDLDNLDDLIDALTTKPRIEPRKDLDAIPPPNLDSNVDNVASETLARILAMQKQYAQAADMYARLALQQPERAAHFRAEAEKLRAHIA